MTLKLIDDDRYIREKSSFPIAKLVLLLDLSLNNPDQRSFGNPAVVHTSKESIYGSYINSG